MRSPPFLKKLLIDVLKSTNLYQKEQEFAFPIIIKQGTNQYQKRVIYYFNYSNDEQQVEYVHGNGLELTKSMEICTGDQSILKPWDFIVVEVC